MKKYKMTIVFIAFIILFTSFILVNNNSILRVSNKNFYKETVRDITYELQEYDYDSNEGFVTITFNDNENGIDEIEYYNGEVLKCGQKNKIAIDLKIKKDVTYKYIMKNKNGDVTEKDVIINDEYLDSLIKIVNCKESEAEQACYIDYGASENSYEGYRIGINSEEWVDYKGGFDIVNFYQNYKVDQSLMNEDGTVTIIAKKIIASTNKEIEIRKDIPVYDFSNLEEYREEEIIIHGESIISCVKENKLKSGNYTFVVNGVDIDGNQETISYKAEVYNYEAGASYVATKNFGNKTSTDKRMLILKYNGDLKIKEQVQLTATRAQDNLTYKKGMFIYTSGQIGNYGQISMTGRGTYNIEGENVYLWKNVSDSTFEYIAANGTAGGEKIGTGKKYYYTHTNGNQGIDAESAVKIRLSGGGGSGANRNGEDGVVTYSGKGASGNSYSGGSGGGAVSVNYEGGSFSAGDAIENGGARWKWLC